MAARNALKVAESLRAQGENAAARKEERYSVWLWETARLEVAARLHGPALTDMSRAKQFGAAHGSGNPESEPSVGRTSDAARSGEGGAYYLDLGRLIKSLPRDVNRKVSLHDLKRVCDNYNTIPCPNCYGGFQRPCQWCGDTGRVIFIPNGAERWADKSACESQSGAGSQNA